MLDNRVFKMVTACKYLAVIPNKKRGNNDELKKCKERKKCNATFEFDYYAIEQLRIKLKIDFRMCMLFPFLV